MSKKNVTMPASAAATADANSDEKNLRSAYAVAEHWISDLKFFSDEVRFFRTVMDKYFLALIEESNIETTRKVATRLASFEKERTTLEQHVSSHMQHLTNLVENPFAYSSQDYKDEHTRLEDSMTRLMKDFRVVKQEVFKVSEYAIDSERSKHLLGK